MKSNRWEDVMPEYRNRWNQRYGGKGSNYRWEDFEPGYRYAYDMYGDPKYSNRSWNEVEPEFRRDWESRYPNRPWNRFGQGVRYAWEDITRGGAPREDLTEKSRTIELREEELRARREREAVGEVGAHKEVVSEKQSVDVPVTHEEVYIERHPVDRPSDKPVGVDEDAEIRMRIHEEHAVPEKETFVREEVEMGKRPVEDTERIHGTVRREELKVDRQGDFDITGGDGYTQPHEHKWVGDRCEICGATRKRRRAA